MTDTTLQAKPNVGAARRKGRPRSVTDPDVATSREKLLKAAINLFAQYGSEPVSTGAVAEAAGLTQSMVHYHFRSKSKLWKASIERLMRDRGVLFPVTRMELQDLDPLTRLKVLTRRFIATSAADPNLARIGLREGMASSGRLRWIVQTYMAAGYRAFDAAATEAIEAGLIRPLPIRDISMVILTVGSIPFSAGALVKEVYGISMAEEETIESFSNSIITMIFEGLQVKPGRTGLLDTQSRVEREGRSENNLKPRSNKAKAHNIKSKK